MLSSDNLFKASLEEIKQIKKVIVLIQIKLENSTLKGK